MWFRGWLRLCTYAVQYLYCVRWMEDSCLLCEMNEVGFYLHLYLLVYRKAGHWSNHAGGGTHAA